MKHNAFRFYSSLFPFSLLFSDHSQYSTSTVNQVQEIGRYGLAAVQIACPNNRKHKGRAVAECDSVLLAEVGPPPTIQSRQGNISFA
jgi:hypothetical protein